jgi:hypothetical protein
MCEVYMLLEHSRSDVFSVDSSRSAFPAETEAGIKFTNALLRYGKEDCIHSHVQFERTDEEATNPTLDGSGPPRDRVEELSQARTQSLS